jgi:hypothetical protein
MRAGMRGSPGRQTAKSRFPAGDDLWRQHYEFWRPVLTMAFVCVLALTGHEWLAGLCVLIGADRHAARQVARLLSRLIGTPRT